MAQTQLRGTQVLDGSVQRSDLDVATAGQAVIRKIIAGSNITLTSTGVDSGTGDVTIDATAASTFPAVASETAPTTNLIKLYAKQTSTNFEDNRLAVITPTSNEILETSFEYEGGLAYAGTSSGLVLVLGSSPTAVGTVTANTETTTNVHTASRRTEYLVTTAATTAIASLRSGQLVCTIGGITAEKGGFYFKMIAGPTTGVIATSRFHMGLVGVTTAPTDAEITGITNHITLSYGTTDTNVQITHRGSGGAATKINLGANFPRPTADRTNLYKLVLRSPPGLTQIVTYEVTNLTNNAVAFGTITTNIPTETTALAFRAAHSVGGVSSVTGLSINSAYFRFNIL